MEKSIEKSVVKDIYYLKNETIKASREYWQALEEVVGIIETLEVDLTEKQKELFRKILNLEGEKEAEMAATHFVEGFKMGLLVGIECSKE